MSALIFCVEPGILYSQAVLLAESIAQYTSGFFKQIYAFSPRRLNQISADEKQVLQSLGVCIIDEPLNTEHLDYPIANKILACLWAEENLSNDFLVMVDTDTVFLQPPLAILNPENDVYMRPVDRPGQASKGADSKFETYWQKAYTMCKVGVPDSMIKTSVSCESIRPYFNAGFVGYKRDIKLANRWLFHLNVLRNHNHHPNNPRCLDQVALAIATADFSVQTLPDTYNYPIPLRSKMVNATMQSHQWQSLVHVHYHRWFQKPGFLDSLSPPLKNHSKQQWLQSMIPLLPLIDDLFPH